MFNFRGDEYITNLYRIPRAKISAMTFHHPTMQEEPGGLIEGSTFVQDGNLPTPRDPGRVGWKLFYHSNLLIDMKHSVLAFCDSFETLKHQGYQTEIWTQASLFLDRGLLEIEADTPDGRIRCILDTGSTWNILNRELNREKRLEDAVWDPENLWQYTHFKITEHEFGPITFHRMPLQLPIQIDALLGMEFFLENLVFLDFSTGHVYFSKINSSTY
jgi:hypothetical protein